MTHFGFNGEPTNHRINTMRSQIELNAFDPMLVCADSRLAAPPVVTGQSRLSTVATDDCPLTCHMPRPQQPPHACCYSSALTLPRRHGNLVSFDLSPVYPANDIIDYTTMTSQSPGQHNRLKLDDDLESRKPLTCPNSATPDVVEDTANRISRQMKFRSVLDEDREERQGLCCRSRCGALLCVIFAMIILSASVIATVLIMNEFPSLTSKLVQDGCRTDADCSQFERCLPINNAVSSHLLSQPTDANTPSPLQPSTSARFRCGCWYQCPAEYRPVCGSDGNTYHNQCQLRLRACHTRVNIDVRATGKCVASDPCVGVICPYGGQCIPSDSQGRTAVCRCVTDCPLPVLSSSSSLSSLESASVCGTDEVTYVTRCHLQRSACIERVNISVAYDGACDVCRTHQCPEDHECVSDPMTGHPSCQCISSGQLCAGESFDPVCASNHVTYNSACHMRAASCELGESLQIAYRGKCKSQAELNGCSQLQCQYGAVCQWNEQQSRPQCVCPRCPPEFAPVCATDGRSYNSECKLRLEACETEQNLRVQYRGMCKGCEKKHCPNYGICESGLSGEATCVCPRTCVPRKEPVCGIDGVTYANQCEMKVAACNQQKFISIAYHGKCDLCENVVCTDGAVCLAGRCLCPLECPLPTLTTPNSTARGDREGEVCGSDLVTYASRCHLEMAACESVTAPTLRGVRSPQLSVRHLGACQTREIGLNEEPAPSRHTLLCRNIQCQFGATCTVNANAVARCACLHSCHRRRKVEPPVCGSDLRLYRSACHMRKQACLTQSSLHRRPMVLCKRPLIRTENNEALCLGMEPLRNKTSSGNFNIQCGAANVCPSGTFCHLRANSSVCCSIKLAKEQNTTSNTLKNTTDNATNASACSSSPIGCCPDGVTRPPGGDLQNCPVSCNCHRLGALGSSCNSDGVCECRAGVSGVKCDRCAVNHWGLQKIEFGNAGCEPCQCNMWGSVRLDCEQSRGRCVCQPGISGDKCDICADGSRITDQNRCRNDNENTTKTTTIQTGENMLIKGGSAASITSLSQAAANSWPSPLADQAQTAEFSQNSHFAPSFTNQSYMVLGSLRSWLHLYLEIEVMFRSANGLLLYYQPWSADEVQPEQKTTDKADNSIQYMYLAIADGYIVYSYNLGFGPIGLKSRNRISLNQYHRILVRRYHSDGQLIVDDGEPVVARGGNRVQVRTQPKLPVYIGHTIGHLRQNTNMKLLNEASTGFVGCIRRLRVDQSKAVGVALGPTVSSDVTASHLVSNCRPRECLNKSCKNKFACDDEECSAGNGVVSCQMDGCKGRVLCRKYLPPQCICPDNKWGNHCHIGEITHSSEPPSFRGDGFLHLKHDLPLKTPLSVEVWFLTRQKDGVILYAAGKKGSLGDSIVVQLQDFSVIASINWAKSDSVVMSSKPITANVWHRIRLHLENDKVSLAVDGATAHSLVTQADTRGRQADILTVYLGGTSRNTGSDPYVGPGLDGAIQMVRLAGQNPVRNLLQVTQSSLNVNKFEGFPCGPLNPCKNGSVCVPRLNRFVCQCTGRYSGRRCQKKEASSKRKRKMQ